MCMCCDCPQLVVLTVYILCPPGSTGRAGKEQGSGLLSYWGAERSDEETFGLEKQRRDRLGAEV